MPTSIPPISYLSIASIQAYDDKMQVKADAELAAGNLSKYEFDESVLDENKALIALREGKIDLQTFQAIQQRDYNIQQSLLAQDPTNGSDS